MAAHPQAADPRLGMELQGRYRILRKLGDGGMGSVYEGQHIKIGRRVAIKILHPHYAQKEEIVERFLREAQAATAIGHPNIIEVTDMGELPDGSAYMVLEYLDGRDWAHDIRHEGPQPVGKIVHVLTQVCDALEHAHAKGIVHRDLKPENIFLIQHRQDPAFVKVLDFGISKFAEQGEDRSLTQTGTALGTPYYMAPEQCQGKKDVDWRADIYALGVMTFQALTGQHPFDDESYPMLVLKICTEAPPPLQAFRPDLPPELVHLVERMLSKLRENRPQSCAEVRAALAPFAQMHAAPVMAANAPSTASQGPSVLQQAGGSSPGTGPYGHGSSPTGTAYLPSSPGVSTPGASQAVAPRSSSKAPLFIGLAAFALLGVAGVVFGTVFALTAASDPEPETPTVSSQPADVEPAPEPTATPEPAPAAEPATEVAAAPPPAAPALVQVAFRVAPEDATIEIDGQARSNPFEGELRPGPHHFLARHDGYVARDEHIEIERDRDVEWALQPETRPRERRTPPIIRTPAPTPTPMPSGDRAQPRLAPFPSPQPSGRGGLVSGSRIF